MTTDNLLDRIPQWLKSLHEMENELRNAARKGLILRKDEATEHLAQARRHLESRTQRGPRCRATERTTDPLA